MSSSGQGWRRSRLPDDDATPATLVMADLHNHSLFSDGRGDPERAFAQMAAAGLDVAALTDHSSIPLDQLASIDPAAYPDLGALAMARTAPRSVDEFGWARTGEIADAHDEPGRFTAIRGFEWTEPWLGHVNVWFSDLLVPVTTPGSLSGLHAWLAAGGRDALFGYNHPGREPGRLSHFAVPDGAEDAAGLRRRMVAMEAFNRTDDFLFAGYDVGQPSPIVDCLDAGWRPGLIGSSDEHGRSYGLAGKGRTGIWVGEHTRAGVRAAMLDRRTFATREPGLRLDATLDGIRAGRALATGTAGRRTLCVDIDSDRLAGRDVELQVLTSGRRRDARTPARGQEVAVIGRLPARAGTVTQAEVTVPEETRWLLLRVADPAIAYGGPAPAGHACSCRALAYASPWW